MATKKIKSQVLQELTVKGESIERVYTQFTEQRYFVNRRYQRKLVWTLDEKINFIDSIRSGYPVPIILFAEELGIKENRLEIIDGMQRLNAIMSFIENDYSVSGEYFDLETMATTKLLLDTEKIKQKTPKMDRATCVKIAAYLLPISIYEFAVTESVDEVFRRINSGGRKLSRQELRSAGATGNFAQAVRKISTKVRGDDTFSDQLLLNEMKLISITNRDLDYGLPAQDVFWVKQGILSKEEIRQSRDEELVSDLVAYMVSDAPPSSRTEYLDDFFSPSENDASKKRFTDIDTFVQRRGIDEIILDFQRTLDQIRLVILDANSDFVKILFPKESLARAPRYFQVVFLAFHELIVKQSKEISNMPALIKAMSNSGKNISVKDGGRWSAEDRQKAVESYVGLIAKKFKKSKQVDPANVHWITQMENILAQSFTEQNLYDFKQGFLRLDGKHAFDDQSFEKILQTATGMANLAKESKGYVIVGVADTEATSKQITKLFKVKPTLFNRFYIVGIEHEALVNKKNLDQYFQLVVDKIRNSKISEPLKSYIAQNVKSVRYHDKSVFVIETKGQSIPSNYDGKYYVRSGNQLDEILSKDVFTHFKDY
jgi:Protein of unknown function DUF262/Putative DNA-binding domain